MQVIQAVYGVFHHFELAHQLRRHGHLRRVYSTWPWVRLKREGLPRELVRTFPLVHTTDYLLRRTRLYSPALDDRFNRWNSDSFDAWLRRTIEPCDAFIAISGAGRTAGPLVQSRGGKFICDRGSTHQRVQNRIVSEEYARWKIPMPPPPAHILEREENIYASADMITVGSNVARRSFLEMGVPSEKVEVIPYGVRLDRFAPTGTPDANTFDVLFAGQVSLRKGIPYLLQAFAKLRHPRKQLTIAGHVQPEIKHMLSQLPQDDVTFLGSLSQPELAKRMSCSHVLVLPSIEEGFGLVMAQAMACGCPVVASTATGVEHLFQDGEAGFYVPPGDSAALASSLQRIADDVALQKQLGEAALNAVGRIGGWDHYGTLWDNLLHRLTGVSRDMSEPC